MDKYKEQLKKIAYDKSTYEKILSISEKYSLHIDQLGELTAEIRDVLMGFRPSKEFTKDVTERLEINEDTAKSITSDVNIILSEIIKTQIQPLTSSDSDIVSSLEKLGGITIENNEGSVSNENTSIKPEIKSDVTAADRAAILNSLENPVPVKPQIVPKINALEASVPEKSEPHVDPLIDHLLTTAVTMPEQKTTASVPIAPKKIVVPQKPSGSDLYREPVN